MDESIKRVRQLAASALARKEQLEEQLGALEAERRQRETERDLAISSADDADALQLTQMIRALDERLDQKRSEVAAAEEAYLAIVDDLRSVQDAAKEHRRLAERAAVDAGLASDPFAASAEDAALENVRRHIDELSIRAGLDEDAELSRKFAAIEKAEAEERAKAQLAELKAKRKKAETAPEPSDAGDSPLGKKPKKTM